MATDAQARVVQYMCKHLVAIGVNFVRAGREEMPPQFCAYSGTVAAFGDKIFNRAGPDEVPSGATDERFVGIVDPMVDLPDIKGMSGGPIFGFSIDPEPRYWAVAIQGSWRRNERLLFGCRFASIENRLLSGGAT